MAGSGVQKGFILIADISGYTRFLTESELDHGTEIIKELLGVVGGRMGEMVKIIRSEGDALFGYIPEELIADKPMLLDLVEGCHVSFHDRLFNIGVQSSCTCNACTNTADLDIKFFAHYGEYMVEDLGGGSDDLSGPQVVLAHRLLKNSVVNDTGLQSYFMVTDPVYEHMERPEDSVAHKEAYEHFGEVGTQVFDLMESLERRRAGRELTVSVSEADLVIEYRFAHPPALVWSYALDGDRSMEWNPYINRIDWAGDKSQRRKAGREMHCAHGENDDISVFQVVDWSPPDHYTYETKEEGFFQPATRSTIYFMPDKGGTKYLYVVQYTGIGALRRWLVSTVARGEYTKAIAKTCAELEAVLDKEQGAIGV